MVEIASSTHENKPDYKYTYIAAFHFPRPQSYRPQRETTTYFKSFFFWGIKQHPPPLFHTTDAMRQNFIISTGPEEYGKKRKTAQSLLLSF